MIIVQKTPFKTFSFENTLWVLSKILSKSSIETAFNAFTDGSSKRQRFIFKCHILHKEIENSLVQLNSLNLLQSAFIGHFSVTEYFKCHSNLYRLDFNCSTVKKTTHIQTNKQTKIKTGATEKKYVSLSFNETLLTNHGNLPNYVQKQMQACKMAQQGEVLTHMPNSLGSTS